LKALPQQNKGHFKLAYGGRDLELMKFLQEKISHDPTNPLFAMLAYFYLDVGKVAEAISVAQRGVISHPGYSTGHVVLGLALLRAGFYSEARKEILMAKELRPNSNVVRKLLEKIEQEERAESIGMKLAEEFLTKKGIMEEIAEVIHNKSYEKSPDDTLIPGLEVLISDKRKKDESLIPHRLLTREQWAPANESESRDISNSNMFPEQKQDSELTVDGGAIDIASLARKLESARPVGAVKDGVDEQGEGLALSPEIVTETLARIFEEQGNVETALEAYRLLVIKRPDRALFYNEKIAELKRKLDKQNE
jgi:hypothetical protein